MPRPTETMRTRIGIWRWILGRLAEQRQRQWLQGWSRGQKHRRTHFRRRHRRPPPAWSLSVPHCHTPCPTRTTRASRPSRRGLQPLLSFPKSRSNPFLKLSTKTKTLKMVLLSPPTSPNFPLPRPRSATEDPRIHWNGERRTTLHPLHSLPTPTLP